MGFYYPGGKLFENQENSGVTALMLHSMLRDTEETSAEQLYRQLEIYGAHVAPVVDKDYFGATVTVASTNIEPVLELLIRMFKSPKFDADEIARQKEILLAKIKLQGSDVKVSLQNQMVQLLFRGHPYGLEALGTETGLGSLAHEAVRSWYEKTVRYHKPIVIIMGDTRGTSLAGYFVENFSGSRYQDTQVPKAFPKPPDKAGKSERDWGGPRTLALIGFQAPPYGDEDSYPLAVLQQYLAGSADDYFARISARQGHAYSFSVQGDTGLLAGQVTACASGQAADTDEIVEVLGDEVGRLLNVEMSYRDFRSARQAALAAFEINRQLRATQLREVVHSVLAGRDVVGLEDYSARLQEVRQEDLPEVARRFFNKDKSVTVVFRGMAAP
jgi:zinc protease